MRKHLVLAAVGDDSLHETWLTDGPRSYDVALAYTGDAPGRFAERAEYYTARRGAKYSLLHDFIRSDLPGAAFDYEFVWMPDDDVRTDSWQIERLFALAAKHRLELCQPAIAAGETSFETLRVHPEYVLRYSRFVEIMCPLFSRDAFVRVMPTFSHNTSGWGLDWLWATMFAEQQIAVLDAVAVEVARQAGSAAKRGETSAPGVDPAEECRRLVELYSIDNRRLNRATCRGTSRIQGILRDGRKVWTRPLLPAVFRRKSA